MNTSVKVEKEAKNDSQIENNLPRPKPLSALPLIELKNNVIISDGGSFYHIVVYKPLAAYRLNKVLGRYSEDTPFQRGSKTVFKVSKTHPNLRAVYNALKLKG